MYTDEQYKIAKYKVHYYEYWVDVWMRTLGMYSGECIGMTNTKAKIIHYRKKRKAARLSLQKIENEIRAVR